MDAPSYIALHIILGKFRRVRALVVSESSGTEECGGFCIWLLVAIFIKWRNGLRFSGFTNSSLPNVVSSNVWFPEKGERCGLVLTVAFLKELVCWVPREDIAFHEYLMLGFLTKHLQPPVVIGVEASAGFHHFEQHLRVSS